MDTRTTEQRQAETIKRQMVENQRLHILLARRDNELRAARAS